MRVKIRKGSDDGFLGSYNFFIYPIATKVSLNDSVSIDKKND
jgi:hypothetical protein